MFNRPHHVALVLSAALLAGSVLAACGGSGAPGENASSRSKLAGETFKFARCLREHGIHVEVTSGGEDIGISGGGDITRQKMEVAQNACSKYRPNAGAGRKLTPEERVAQEESVRKFAKCMREHGIHVETQVGNGGAVRIGVHSQARAGSSGSEGPNPESPAFEQAQKDCQGLMPGPKDLKGGPIGFRTKQFHGPKSGSGSGNGVQFHMQIVPGG